jgi:hypothetical protein
LVKGQREKRSKMGALLPASCLYSPRGKLSYSVLGGEREREEDGKGDGKRGWEEGMGRGRGRGRESMCVFVLGELSSPYLPGSWLVPEAEPQAVAR